MLTWIIVLAVAAILAFVLGAYCQYHWLRRPLEELRWYRRNHRFMSIGCNGRSFDLESLDGGLHWYVVERNKDGGAAIVGPVEQVCPNEFRTHQFFEKLFDHVKRHGPIDPSRVSDQEALRSMGATVVIEDKTGSAN